LHPIRYLTEKGVGNPLAWQYRLKCYLTFTAQPFQMQSEGISVGNRRGSQSQSEEESGRERSLR